MSLFDDLDLGAEDYDKKKESGLSQFISKPSPRKFQPFGGPAPVQHPVQQAPVLEPEPAPQQSNFSPFDELDAYDQAKSAHSAISSEHSKVNELTSVWDKRYDSFLKDELTPFYNQHNLYGEIADKKSGDEYLNQIDNYYAQLEKDSQEEDGFFGASDRKTQALEGLKNFGDWAGPNGMRARFLKMRDERDRRRKMRDELAAQKTNILDRMVSIPLERRVQMDQDLKSRGKGPKDSRSINRQLDGMTWEKPVIDPQTNEVINLSRVDPRYKFNSVPDPRTGKDPIKSAQNQRLAKAMQGNISAILQEREVLDKNRILRTKGYMTPHTGTHPRGLSRVDTDILDAEAMRDAGIKDFKGTPIEDAIQQLGGEEGLETAKILKGVYQAKEIYRSAQMDLIKNAGNGKATPALREKLDEARDNYHGMMHAAGEHGLNSRIYEQMTSRDDEVGWWEGIKRNMSNAWNRGLKMADQAELSDELALNRLGESTIQDMIKISQDIEDMPGSKSLQRLQNMKSSNVLSAIGKILFEEPEAIPEMLTEVMTAYLPTFWDTGVKVALPASTAVGIVGKMKGKFGILSAIGVGTRLNAGLASFALEYTGKVMEELGEMGIDIDDPFIVAAAWEDERVRNELRKKAAQKAGGVALFDTFSGMMAGRVRQTANYMGMKTGRLTNASKFAKFSNRTDWQQAGLDVPIFTKGQRLTGVGAEEGLQVASGMSGELLGQLLSRDPGESLDYDAIAAEGVLDLVSPFGIYGSFREVMKKPDNFDFTQSTPTYSNPEPYFIGDTPVGTTGTVTRAGMTNTWHSFDSSDSMAAHVMDASNIDFDSPQGKWLQHTIMQLQNMNPAEFKKMRLIMAERAPHDVTGEGFFEHDEDGSYTLSFNKKMMQENPMRAFMHESGHFARRQIFKNNEEFYEMYRNLGEPVHLDSLAEYVLKVPNIKFSSIKDKAKKAAVLKYYQNVPLEVQAEEWFTLQYARVLAGNKADKSIVKPLDNFLKEFIRPAMEGWMGSVENAGEDAINIDARILDAMGWGPNGTRMGEDLPHSFTHPGVRAGALPSGFEGMTEQEGLNFLSQKIREYDLKEQKELIESVEAILGRKFYTKETTAFGTAEEKLEKAKEYKAEASRIREEVTERKKAEPKEKPDTEQSTGIKLSEKDGGRRQTFVPRDSQAGVEKAKGDRDPVEAFDAEVEAEVQGRLAETPVERWITELNEIEKKAAQNIYNVKEEKDGGATVTKRSPGSLQKVGSKVTKKFKSKDEADTYVKDQTAADLVESKKIVDSLKKVESLITNPKELRKQLKAARNAEAKRLMKEEEGIEYDDLESSAKLEYLDKYVQKVSLLTIISDMTGFSDLIEMSKGGSSQWGSQLVANMLMKVPGVHDIEEMSFLGEDELKSVSSNIQARKQQAIKEAQTIESSLKKLQKAYPKKNDQEKKERGKKVYRVHTIDQSKEKYTEQVSKTGKKQGKNEKYIVGKDKMIAAVKKIVGEEETEALKNFESGLAKLYKNNFISKKGNILGLKPGTVDKFVLIVKGYEQPSDKKLKKKTDSIPEKTKKAIKLAVIDALELQAKSMLSASSLKPEDAYINFAKLARDQDFRESQAEHFVKNGFHKNFITAFLEVMSSGPDGKPLTPKQVFAHVEKGLSKGDPNEKLQDDQTAWKVRTKFNKNLNKLISAPKEKTKTDKKTKKKTKYTPYDSMSVNSVYRMWSETITVDGGVFSTLKQELGKDPNPEQIAQRLSQIMRKPEALLAYLGKEGKKARLDALKARIQALEEAEMLYAPEDYTITWKNVALAPSLRGGTAYIRETQGQEESYRRVTLDDMARTSDNLRYYVKSKDGKFYGKDKDGKEYVVLKPQESLKGFYTSFDLAKLKKPDEATSTYGGLTPRQYALALAAASASRHSPAKGKSVKNNLNRDTIESYTSDQGTNLLQILAYQIFELNEKSLDADYEKDGTLVRRPRMAELSDQKTPQEALLYDLVNAANWTGAAWENSKQGKMLWLMYQKSQYFAEAIRLAETTKIPKESEKSRLDRIEKYKRNLSVLLHMERSGPDEVGVDRYRYLEPDFDKDIIKDTSKEAQYNRTLAFERLKKLHVKYENVEVQKGRTPLEFKDWLDGLEGHEKDKQSYKEYLHYLRIVENRRVLQARYTAAYRKKTGQSYKQWLNEKDADGKYINRREAVSDGIISQGGQTELPIEMTPEGIIGGSLWTGALSQYEFEYMKAEALQKVLQVWKDDIEGDGLWTSGLSTKYRETLGTIGQEASEEKFIERLQKRRFKASTSEKFDQKKYNTWAKKNKFDDIPRSSKKLGELLAKRQSAYNNRKGPTTIAAITKEIEDETESIRQTAAAVRQKIFNEYAKLERDEVIDPKNVETNEAILSNLEKQFVEQKPNFSSEINKDSRFTEDGKAAPPVKINWQSNYRVRVAPKSTDFDDGPFVFPSFRKEDYEFVADSESMQNPDRIVEADEGIHGAFKLSDIDRRHSLLSIYMKQSQRAFAKMFDIEDEDGKVIPGVKQDDYGKVFEIPDRIRNDKGQLQAWNRVYTEREQLNETFLKSSAQEGDVIKFKGTDSDGKSVRVEATYSGDVWVDKNGKELSHRMGVLRNRETPQDIQTRVGEEYYNRPSIFDQATQAYADKLDAEGRGFMESTSDLHYSALTLIKQVYDKGMSSFNLFATADTREKGFVDTSAERHGQRFSPFIITRVIQPLLSQIYKDLKINTEAIVPTDREDAPEITYGELLESLDLLSDGVTQEQIDAAAISEDAAFPPDGVVLSGEGHSEFIQSWFQSNIPAYASGERFKGRSQEDAGTIILEESTEKVDGLTRKKPAVVVTDQDIDFENADMAQAVVFLHSSKDGSQRAKDLKKLTGDKDIIEVNLTGDIDFKDLAKQVKNSIGNIVEGDYNLMFHTTGAQTAHQAKIKQALDAIFKGIVPGEKKKEGSEKSKGKGQKPKETAINFAKGQNSYLSNFQPLGKPIEYKGNKFYTVEAAYQAYKNKAKSEEDDGAWVKQFTEEGLSGAEARELASASEVKADVETSEQLMRELLTARFNIDKEFVSRLKSSSNFTHPVKDTFWSKKFPELLEELKQKAKSKAWFEDSDIWNDPYDRRDKARWLGDFRQALDPIFSAVLNARRLDIYKQIKDEDKQQEVVTRSFYAEDLVSLNDAVPKTNRAEKEDQNEDAPEGFDHEEENYGRETKHSDATTEPSTDTILDESSQGIERFNSALLEIANELDITGKSRSVFTRNLLRVMKREKVSDINVFISAAMSHLVHNTQADSRQAEVELQLDKFGPKGLQTLEASVKSKERAIKAEKDRHEKALSEIIARKVSNSLEQDKKATARYKEAKDHRVNLRGLNKEIAELKKDIKRFKALREEAQAYSLRKLFDETDIPRPPALGNQMEDITGMQITELQDWWENLSKADEAVPASFYKLIRSTFDAPDITSLNGWFKNIKKVKRDLEKAEVDPVEYRGRDREADLISDGDEWRRVDDPGRLQVNYQFDKELAKTTGYGFKITKDRREGLGAQFTNGDIVKEIKVQGKIYSLKGANELDVQSALAQALKDTRIGDEVVVLVSDSSGPRSVARSLGSSFGKNFPVEYYPNTTRLLSRPIEKLSDLKELLSAVQKDATYLYKKGRVPVTALGPGTQVMRGPAIALGREKHPELLKNNPRDKDMANVAKILKKLVAETPFANRTKVGGEELFRKSRKKGQGGFLRVSSAGKTQVQMALSEGLRKLPHAGDNTLTNEFIHVIFHETLHALTSPIFTHEKIPDLFQDSFYKSDRLTYDYGQTKKIDEGIDNIRLLHQLFKSKLSDLNVDPETIAKELQEEGKVSDRRFLQALAQNLKYAASSPAEFVAESMSFPPMMKILASMEITEKDKLFLDSSGYKFDHDNKEPKNMFRALVEVLLKIIGLKPKDIDGSLFERVLVDTEKLVENEEEYQFRRFWADKVGNEFLNKKMAEDQVDSIGSSLGSSFANQEKLTGIRKIWDTLSDRDNWRELKEHTKAGYNKTVQGPGGMKDKFLVDYVDKFRPVKELFYGVKDILKTDMEKGSEVYDALNTWGKIHTYLGIGHTKLEAAQLKYHEPIMEALRDTGTSLEDAGQYLQARMAPSRNVHHRKQIEDQIKDLSKIKDLNERADRLKVLNTRLENEAPSGISEADAIAIVNELEDPSKEGNIRAFLDHKNNPLQLFYEQQQNDLETRVSDQLINREEASRMKSAASYFNWGLNGSRYMFKDSNGKVSNYSYAPMQGFEGEFQSMVDGEKAWEILGQGTSSSGKGFDQPKLKFLSKGAFGRYGKETDENGNKGITGPDPKIVFGVAEQQHTEGMIRGSKNTVSQSFGQLHDVMRRIAKGAEEGLPDKLADLDLEKLHKNKELREAMNKEYDKFFKTHIREVSKTEYVIEDIAPEDEAGGNPERFKMITKTINNDFKNDPHVFVFRKEGVPHYVSFQENAHGKMLAASMKNMRYEALPELLKLLNEGTRFMSQMFTSKNPNFVVPNFLKDFGTTILNLSEDDKKDMIKDTIKPGNIKKFGKAIFKAEKVLKKDKKSPVDISEFNKPGSAQDILAEGDPVKMYMFVKARGGLVGYFNAKSVPKLVQDMMNTADAKKQTKPKQIWNAFNAYLDAANSVAENSLRVSAFWAAIKSGRSTQEAALISRNLTVDFNQGGNKSNAMNSMYMFFRAATNGIDRAYRSLMKRSSKERYLLVGGIVGASMGYATLARLLDDDEEEETEPMYDQVSAFARHRKIIVPMPGWLLEAVGIEDKGHHIRLDLPLGLPAGIWGAGQTLADLAAYYNPYTRGGHGLMESGGNLMGDLQDIVNPFGSGDILSLLTPSIATPFIELKQNKNFMGGDIRYAQSPFGDPVPAHKLDPKGTPKAWNLLSQGINQLGGGSDVTVGSLRGALGMNPAEFTEEEDWKWDWSGSQIRHLLYGFLGGPFDVVEKTGVTAHGIFSDTADVDFKNIPVLQRFLRNDTYGGSTKRKMYNLKDAVNSALADVKAAPPSEKAARTKYNQKLLQFAEDVAQYDKRRLKAKDMEAKINASNRSDVEKVQLIANYEAKQLEFMTKVINRAQKAGLRV